MMTTTEDKDGVQGRPGSAEPFFPETTTNTTTAIMSLLLRLREVVPPLCHELHQLLAEAGDHVADCRYHSKTRNSGIC